MGSSATCCELGGLVDSPQPWGKCIECVYVCAGRWIVGLALQYVDNTYRHVMPPPPPRLSAPVGLVLRHLKGPWLMVVFGYC